MNIRLMTMDDYSSGRQLWTSTPGMGQNGFDDSLQGIQRYLRRNPDSCFVAEEGGRLLGTILAGQDGRRGFIYHLAVAEHARRQGIGSSLARAAQAALKAQGIRKVALVVFADNQAGNLFWESQGFTLRTDLSYRNRECEASLERV